MTEGSTRNQRTPAVELAPNVFYAPPSRNFDFTSRGNEKSGWLCFFEETVPPPFGRAVDPGVQYVKVNVRYAGKTELVEGAWLRFQVPIGVFPPEFIAGVYDTSLVTTCSFPVPHCEKYLYATFVTPVDIRHVIAQYQNRGCCVGCCWTSQQKPDYGLGPAREPPTDTVGSGCGAACGAGGGGVGGASEGFGGGGCCNARPGCVRFLQGAGFEHADGRPPTGGREAGCGGRRTGLRDLSARVCDTRTRHAPRSNEI